MLRYVPIVASVFAIVGHTGPAVASAEDYEACRNAVADARELKRCGTFRDELRECSALRPVSVDAPAECLEAKLIGWRSVLEREEREATTAGLRGDDDLSAWSEELRALCRDAEEQRLSAERYGAPHAAFEAAKCELRRTIRRLVETSAKLRGFE